MPFAAAWRVLGTTWFLSAVLFVITWPVPTLAPAPGLDFSFVAGLHMAAHEHLQFGTQIIATYGPLGFLRYPFLYYTWTARLALAYTAGVHLALCFTLLWALRRMLPGALAFLLAWIAVAIVAGEPESALVVVLVWLVEAARSGRTQALGGSALFYRAFPALAGAVAGLEVLVKINTGATIAILAAIAVLVAYWRRWRQIWLFVAFALASFMVGWFATGQGLSNLGAYISTARQIVSGWSTAMQYLGPHSQLWAALVVAVAVFAIGWQTTRHEALAVRVAALCMWLVLGFSTFKEGFVGQSPDHEGIFFAAALGAAIAFGWRGVQRGTALWGLTVVALAWFSVTQADPGHLLDPSADAQALRSQVTTMTNAAKRDRLVADARASMDAAYGLDPATLAELQGHTVDVLPSEQSILWANRLRWMPVPVYQLYYALTPALDNADAERLASAGAPERLLRNLSPSVNNRNNLFDSPATQRSMLCHYRSVSTTAAYEVLTRTAGRCGRPQPLATTKACWQQFVAVPKPPRPDELVYATVSGAAPHGMESLRSLLWRSYMRAIGLKYGAGPVRDFSVVPDTLSDGLLMSVPARADFPGPFALDPQADELAIGTSSGSLAKALTYRFYAQRIAP